MKTIWMLAAKYLRRNPKRTGIMVICMSLVVMMITVIIRYYGYLYESGCYDDYGNHGVCLFISAPYKAENYSGRWKLACGIP